MTVQYLSGTARHVKRRQVEMKDVAEMLVDVGYQSPMINGVAVTHSRITDGKMNPLSNDG